ncbi:MAG: hypothetical protein LPD71_00165 [Shewanella sp.]|nr:hypothetical protein [Shewanella sp.]MCF1457214.1 hypothetical protein [Shewanella sp.]
MALTQVKGSILSDELYRRENNLSDVQDKAAGRNNLGVYGKSEVYQKSETYGKSETYARSETYNRSEMESRFLNESSNLADLDSTYYARSNLDVYSKSEVDSRLSVVDYALLDFGTVSKNNRYVKSNPFGSIPCIVRSELNIDGVWGHGGWGSYNNDVRGTKAFSSVVSGEIIVQTGAQGVLGGDASSYGHMFGIISSKTSAPCRVHIWRCGQ